MQDYKVATDSFFTPKISLKKAQDSWYHETQYHLSKLNLCCSQYFIYREKTDLWALLCVMFSCVFVTFLYDVRILDWLYRF